MSELIIRATEDGLHLSPEELERAGIKPNTMLRVSGLPDEREIVGAALGYTTWKLGDALGITNAAWSGSVWTVDIITRDGLRLGQLTLDASGEVLVEKAPSYEDLLATYDALRTSPAAA